VPLKAPSTAYKFNKPANVPWFYPNIYGTDIYVPWNATQFMVFNTTETARLLNGASENKYMCYTVTPADFTDTTDNTLSQEILMIQCSIPLAITFTEETCSLVTPLPLDLLWTRPPGDSMTSALTARANLAISTPALVLFPNGL
jgi:hypothetical protein